MKNAAMLYFRDERYVCDCGALVAGEAHEVEKSGFKCHKCAEPLTCIAELSDGREYKFRRLVESDVAIGDDLIVGGVGNRLPHQVLGIAVNSTSRNFLLKGHGAYRVPFRQILCVVPRRWT